MRKINIINTPSDISPGSVVEFIMLVNELGLFFFLITFGQGNFEKAITNYCLNNILSVLTDPSYLQIRIPNPKELCNQPKSMENEIFLKKFKNEACIRNALIKVFKATLEKLRNAI